jgi:single-strand DNA-binding protein
MNLNKAMIIGNLTKDPEIRQTGSGMQVASFSVATNMVWKDASGQKQEKVEFHNIVAWKNLADICARYLKKGSKVYVEGRLQTRDWQGKDGLKRYTTEIVAENMIMLDGRGQAGAGTNSYQAPSNPRDNEVVYDNLPSNNNDEDISVENIPF